MQGNVNDADWDSDGDGLSNILEQSLGTMPHLVDTDDDGVDDGREYYGILRGELERTGHFSHPLMSMSHYDPAYQDANIDGNHVKLTPSRSLDISAFKTGMGAGWSGIRLPDPEDKRFKRPLKEIGRDTPLTFETLLLPVLDQDADGDHRDHGGNCSPENKGVCLRLCLGYEVKDGEAYLYAVLDLASSIW